jgi:hypothetical protein
MMADLSHPMWHDVVLEKRVAEFLNVAYTPYHCKLREALSVLEDTKRTTETRPDWLNGSLRQLVDALEACIPPQSAMKTLWGRGQITFYPPLPTIREQLVQLREALWQHVGADPEWQLALQLRPRLEDRTGRPRVKNAAQRVSELDSEFSAAFRSHHGQWLLATLRKQAAMLPASSPVQDDQLQNARQPVSGSSALVNLLVECPAVDGIQIHGRLSKNRYT